MPEISASSGMKLTAAITAPSSIPTEMRVEWDRLCSDSPHLRSPFFSRSYACVVEAVRPGVRVCVISSDGRPKAFLPFQFPSAWHRWMGSAERIGGEMTDQFGLIASSDFRITPDELLRLTGLSSLYFTHLPESQAEIGLSGANPETALQIHLDRGTEAYWAEIVLQEKKFFSELRRLRNSLERRVGPIRFELQSSVPSEEFEKLVKLKKEQYQRSEHGDSLGERWKVELLRRLLGEKSPQCTGVLSTLYAGDTWISSHFGLLGNGTLQFWFPVYNPEFRSYKPGYLLLQSVINEAESLGIRRIDRGSGDTLAKRLFANHEYRMRRGMWTSGDARAIAYRLGCSLKWRLQALTAADAK